MKARDTPKEKSSTDKSVRKAKKTSDDEVITEKSSAEKPKREKSSSQAKPKSDKSTEKPERAKESSKPRLVSTSSKSQTVSKAEKVSKPKKRDDSDEEVPVKSTKSKSSSSKSDAKSDSKSTSKSSKAKSSTSTKADKSTKSASKSSSKTVKVEEKAEEEVSAEEDSDDPNAPVTKEWLEKALITRVKEFAKLIRSITLDLEEQETEYFKELESKGETLPESLWAGSSFKIDLTKGLLLNMFKPERLMKYYWVYLVSMKKFVDKRKEKFFMEAKIFPGAKEEYIVFFKNLWAIDGTMTDVEKAKCWEFLDTFIAIVEDWQELTGWLPTPEDKLMMPEVDFDEAANEIGLGSSDD